MADSGKEILIAGIDVPFAAVAMEVERPDLLKRLEQGEAETTESGSVQGVVIDDKGDDPGAVTVDDPLSEPQELDAVILDPLRIPLAERKAFDLITARIGSATR